MAKNKVTDPMFPECPVRNVLASIGNKWSILVLLTLESNQKPMRFSSIETAIPDISQKMLSQTLRDLEADGMILRQAYAEIPPRVEYTLTARSHSLLPIIHNLVDWALDNFNDIINDRTAYFRK